MLDSIICNLSLFKLLIGYALQYGRDLIVRIYQLSDFFTIIKLEQCFLHQILSFYHYFSIKLQLPRPVPRIDFGESSPPPKVDLLDLKCGVFKLHPLNPPTKIQFFVHFVTKMDLSANQGWCVAPTATPVHVSLEVLTIFFLLPIHPSQLFVCVSIC